MSFNCIPVDKVGSKGHHQRSLDAVGCGGVCGKGRKVHKLINSLGPVVDISVMVSS